LPLVLPTAEYKILPHPRTSQVIASRSIVYRSLQFSLSKPRN
jgi:hypothetical protein